MTQIDFYLLPGDTPGSRQHFACRLIETIWKKGHRVYVHLADQPSAEAFSDILWQFKPEAFIPHGLLGQHPPSPVELGWQAEPGDHHDVLLNLDLKTPTHFSRFERVAEIIDQDEQIMQPKRAAWRFYKERGYLIRSHDMRH
ncbi:DNA polymerase III subunit chi [Marinospirillum sp. MEB164]|uniref:DNA polymerase III subunit chi n=1 Tax=Marinospirillum alkalitolerans TaxID=3123374 RepID=A0ABW8PTG1_9GAMM